MMLSKHFHIPLALFMAGLLIAFSHGIDSGGGYEMDEYESDPELEAAFAEMEEDLDLAMGDYEQAYGDDYEQEEDYEAYEYDESDHALSLIGEVVGLLMVSGVRVGLGLLACFVTAKLMVFDFSPWLSAAVKLAAIFVFPAAVASYVPYVGFGVQFVLYYVLLSWLFEIGGTELHVFAGVIYLVNMLATVVGSMLVMGLLIGL